MNVAVFSSRIDMSSQPVIVSTNPSGIQVIIIFINSLLLNKILNRLEPGRNSDIKEQIELFLGLVNKSSPEPQSVRFDDVQSFSSIFIHENYNGTTLENDIALIHLSRSVQFNDNIRPICLPFFKNDGQQSGFLKTTGELFQIAGWGRNSTRDFNQYPDVLQDATVPALDIENCKTAYTNKRQRVTDLHICAGSNGTDSCSV